MTKDNYTGIIIVVFFYILSGIYILINNMNTGDNNYTIFGYTILVTGLLTLVVMIYYCISHNDNNTIEIIELNHNREPPDIEDEFPPIYVYDNNPPPEYDM